MDFYKPTPENIASLVSDMYSDLSDDSWESRITDSNSITYLMLGAHESPEQKTTDLHVITVNAILREMAEEYKNACREEQSLPWANIVIYVKNGNIRLSLSLKFREKEVHAVSYRLSENNIKAFLEIVTDNRINIYDSDANPHFVYDPIV